ncbi:hypothetical protein [Polaromonas hydrogenivorans]|uniref:Uncharacterized protein n=1 Tax=Polaromonas hydrogenivorans TaxID=335476 RepID=A0AAU7M082_9BURK
MILFDALRMARHEKRFFRTPQATQDHLENVHLDRHAGREAPAGIDVKRPLTSPQTRTG